MKLFRMPCKRFNNLNTHLTAIVGIAMIIKPCLSFSYSIKTDNVRISKGNRKS